MKKKKFNHIKQKKVWDCCIASIAMLAGVSYKKANDAYMKVMKKPQHDGLSNSSILKILKKLKISGAVVEAVVLNVPGILCLPSLNDEGSFHAVYFDGRYIYDPNYQIPGKKYYKKELPKKFPLGTELIVNMNDPLTNNVMKKVGDIKIQIGVE